VLAFLDSLCDALIARDGSRIRSLLAHPLARALPRSVRDEARAIASGDPRRTLAPLHALRLYHQTAHLLGVSADLTACGDVRASPARDGERRQMELPLQAAAQ
jgi:phage baseplate assembly protein W